MTDSTIKGLKELEDKLVALGGAVGAKVLRSASLLALTPVVREAKLRIPVGDDAHRTYKGNLVSPGFAKRSVKKASWSNRVTGKAKASVGVKREAFYAVSFVELGTSKMDAQEWLLPAFLAQRKVVEQRFAKTLKRKIEQAVK